MDKNQKVILGTLKPSEDEKKIREIEWKIIEGSLDEDDDDDDDDYDYDYGNNSKNSQPDHQVGIEMARQVINLLVFYLNILKNTSKVQPEPTLTPDKDLIAMILEDDVAVAMTGKLKRFTFSDKI